VTERIVARRVFRGSDGGEVVATVLEPMEAHDEGVRFYLQASGETLTWGTDGEPGDYGIARPIPDGFGVDIERQLHELVEAALTRLVHERVRARGPAADKGEG
jgi:hypothetical protein